MKGMTVKFTADLARVAAKVREKSTTLVRDVGRALYNEMSSGGEYSPGTPVGFPKLWKRPAREGYVPGFARRSWNGSYGAPALATHASAEEADAQVRGVLDGLEIGQTFIAANGAPYIRRLEFDGHSQQAPDGFVRPATEAIQLIVDEVASHLASQ